MKIRKLYVVRERNTSKVLLYWDKDWECLLFPYTKLFKKCDFIKYKGKGYRYDPDWVGTEVVNKYSVDKRKNTTYLHIYYEVEVDAGVVDLEAMSDEQERDYVWRDIHELERDFRTQRVNGDVIDEVKKLLNLY